jgi:hypothetical protein
VATAPLAFRLEQVANCRSTNLNQCLIASTQSSSSWPRKGESSRKASSQSLPRRFDKSWPPFQFQRSGQWILKVIQALVAAGAERIELRASHTRLLIDYSCPKSPWGEAELEVAFKSPDETAGRALKHLAQALWHVFLQGRFTLEFRGRSLQPFAVLDWTRTGDSGSLSLARSPTDRDPQRSPSPVSLVDRCIARFLGRSQVGGQHCSRVGQLCLYLSRSH